MFHMHVPQTVCFMQTVSFTVLCRISNNTQQVSLYWRLPGKHIRGHTGDGFLRVKWPNQQCQSTEGR